MIKLPPVRHVFIVESPYYPHISQGLRDGAEAFLNENGVKFTAIKVPGALEIPAAINMVHQFYTSKSLSAYNGYIALGCVIRGETSHYDIVSLESARGLQQLAIQHQLCIGNGILTVENEAQAIVRADPKHLNKGGFAAQACLEMISLKYRLSLGEMLND